MKRYQHHFIRLFASIVAITIVILLTEALLVFYSMFGIEKKWPAFVTEEYIASVESAIQISETVNPQVMINAILNTSIDRVSGIILRDESGKLNMTFGDVFRRDRPDTAAITMSSADSEISAALLQDDSGLNMEDVHVLCYVFNMDGDRNSGYTFSLEKQGTKKKSLSLPSEINPRDISASIEIRANGNVNGYFDVIAVKIGNFTPARLILDSILIVLVATIPVSLIIAVILSYRITKKNNKQINEIKGNLEKLSRNEFDITSSPSKEEELNEISSSIEALATRLEQNQKARLEWLRSISHDLNTPLTSIRMLTDGASDGVFPLDENLIASIKRENDTLIARIASVRFYSSLLSSDYELEKIPVDTSALIQDVISSIGHEDSFSLDVKTTTLTLDYKLISRALYEVLMNAYEYGDKEVPVKIEVSDNAIRVINKGSLPHPRPDFFEPWERGDISRHEGGSGMGLPIVGRIMALHNGKATVNEKDGSVIVELLF